MDKGLKKASVWMPLVLAIAIVAGMWLGKLLYDSATSTDTRSKLSTILELVKASYVDDIDTDSLLEKTLPDLLSRLDPHSVYIPASELQSVNEELDGSFSGIGISFNLLNDTINVLEVISGGPSERAGLMAGDRIVSINDSVVAGQQWTTSQVMSSLRGPRDSVVKLGIRRPAAKEQLTFEVTRGDVPVTSVDAAYMLAPEIGFIKISKFSANTYSEFLTSMINLRAEGARKFVIDLRGNGGGFMSQAELMANEFLPAGSPIVSMRGKTVGSERPTFSDGSGSFKDSELVVLIDETSASASEIFAGAVQDNDRGLVVGRRSFGKGLVQNQMMLPDSSAVRLTIARYYTPSGRCIQKTYAPGTDYERDILTRYEHGEFYSADSIKLDKSQTFSTLHGRTVYGGGGIMPDIFVANDTTGITSYYLNVVNSGLMQKYTFDYSDRNRGNFEGVADAAQLVKLLPDDASLLADFVSYCSKNGIAPRPYYINISRDLIVNQLKALIARNVLGVQGYYEVYNHVDPTVLSAIRALDDGSSAFPVTKQ